MTTATDTRESLSTALKTSTAEAHDKAEHSVFMDELLAGKLSVADFIALQEQSWLFYSAPLPTTRWHLKLLTPPWSA